MTLSKKVADAFNSVLSIGVDTSAEGAESHLRAFGTELEALAKERFGNRAFEKRGGLRLSQMGTPCDRQFWYKVNAPELGEDLPPEVRFKFIYGDLIEASVVLTLRLGGVDVRDTQREVELEGIVGHIDGIIDDAVIDIKSASTYAMSKFYDGIGPHNDPFGYRVQLYSYATALGLNKAAFIAVDKQHGRIVVDEHVVGDREQKEIREYLRARKEIAKSSTPPPRSFSDVPDGKSGNMKLGVQCSYCAFKKECWPGLRCFVYSNGPRFLTRVEKEPNVREGTV